MVLYKFKLYSFISSDFGVQRVVRKSRSVVIAGVYCLISLLLPMRESNSHGRIQIILAVS